MSRFNRGTVRSFIGVGFGVAAGFCMANALYIGAVACFGAAIYFASNGVKKMMSG